MVFSAGLAWATADWWRYHIAVGVMAVVMVGALNGLALETRPRHPPLRRPAIQLKKKFAFSKLYFFFKIGFSLWHFFKSILMII
jgi:anti-sigma-K factor RskA